MSETVLEALQDSADEETTAEGPASGLTAVVNLPIPSFAKKKQVKKITDVEDVQ